MAGCIIRSVMMETSPETAMFTARDYRFIHEKLALNAGECGNNKRVRPFQLPSIIRKRKKRGTPPNVIASALTEPDDTDPAPLSDSLVGAPEMGEYSQMTWRAFGDLLNGMDCRELSRMSERSEYHAVAVSLAMGLQGVQYCFSGCHRCNRSPRSMKYTGLAD
eukprot:jgi/Mesvir1/22288/Mv17047-RA.1